MYRHLPQTRRLVELVEGGAIGRLRQIAATFRYPLTDPENVRWVTALDGGALMDVGCYCVSGARLLGGEPLHVSGEQVTGETGIDLAYHGTLVFAEDVVAQIDASFVTPLAQRLEAVGEDGEIAVEAPWRQDWGGDMLLRRRGRLERVDYERPNAYRLELENLADAIRGRAAPLLGRDDALGQARTIEALYESAAERRAVTL